MPHLHSVPLTHILDHFKADPAAVDPAIRRRERVRRLQAAWKRDPRRKPPKGLGTSSGPARAGVGRT